MIYTVVYGTSCNTLRYQLILPKKGYGIPGSSELRWADLSYVLRVCAFNFEPIAASADTSLTALDLLGLRGVLKHGAYSR